MVDGSMGLNLMMAGQRFSRRGLLGHVGVAWGCLSRVVHVLPARCHKSTNAGHWP